MCKRCGSVVSTNLKLLDRGYRHLSKTSIGPCKQAKSKAAALLVVGNKDTMKQSFCHFLAKTLKNTKTISIEELDLAGIIPNQILSSFLTKIEELNAGSDKKQRHSAAPPGFQPGSSECLHCAVFFSLSDPTVSSSTFVKEKKSEFDQNNYILLGTLKRPVAWHCLLQIHMVDFLQN